jgi:hypothetical protein
VAADDERTEGSRLAGARPLVGYRDVGVEVRHSRGALIRGWVILLCLALFYLGWTLTVYFLEPGLR